VSEVIRVFEEIRTRFENEARAPKDY
jgi:hypothetical protein